MAQAMTLPPERASAFIDTIVNTAIHAGAEGQRAVAYSQAQTAASIGLQFDEIKVLVDQLIRDLDNVPTPRDVADLSGASSFAAAAFAQPLHDTVKAAFAATHAVRNQITRVSDAVLLTITELADADAVAKQVLGQQAADLRDTTMNVVPATPLAPPRADVIGVPTATATPTPAASQEGGTAWR